jgi:hypothetical protein
MAQDAKILDHRDIQQAILYWIDNGCKSWDTYASDKVDIEVNGARVSAVVYK